MHDCMCVANEMCGVGGEVALGVAHIRKPDFLRAMGVSALQCVSYTAVRTVWKCTLQTVCSGNEYQS